MYVTFHQNFRWWWLQAIRVLRSRCNNGGNEWVGRLHHNCLRWAMGYCDPYECYNMCIQTTPPDWKRYVESNQFLVQNCYFLVVYYMNNTDSRSLKWLSKYQLTYETKNEWLLLQSQNVHIILRHLHRRNIYRQNLYPCCLIRWEC